MWNKRIVTYLKTKGFDQSQADPSLFIKMNEKKDLVAILAIYVDDCIILGTSNGIQFTKETLQSEFKMTDLGIISGILGINITHTGDGIALDQRAYLIRTLECFGMSDCRPIATPALPTNMSEKEDSNEVSDQTQYRQAIGSLLYLSKCTRPDITYAVNQVAQKVEKPTKSDWTKVKRIFRYLKGTLNFGLVYTRGESLNVSGYSDASYAMNEDRKSTSGYAYLANGAAITWRSKKQPIVTTSSMEAEFVALASATKEALWIKKLNNELMNENMPVEIKEDNQSCIKFSHDFIHSDRTKHIDVRYYFVREKVEEGKIKLTYCPTTEMIADIFTKALGPILFAKFVKALGLRKI